MNPKSFLGMMSDISDEYIASAAEPHSKPIRWYQISAVAACIVLMISAVVYPKLRTPKPETIELPAIQTSITETLTTATEQTSWTDALPVTAPPQSSTAALTSTVRTTSAETGIQTVTQTITAQSGTAGTTGTTTARPHVTNTGTTANHTTGTRTTTGTHASATRSATHSTSTHTQISTTVRTTVQSTESEIGSQTMVHYTNIETNPTGVSTTGIFTTAVSTMTTPPEPRTLNVPVYKQPYDPSSGRITDPPPENPTAGVIKFTAEFMQTVFHWSPPGITLTDYDYLRIGIGANAADASLLHAECSNGEWVITVGLQSQGAGIYLDKFFLLPVPKDMNVIPSKCKVVFQSVAVADQPSEIEMNIH